ncbi:MAG: hypothetical protein JRF37_06630 [Deltaproteobacteria bacterium]|nr:hypothetical protein [Deltaproteobacteria bacterium]
MEMIERRHEFNNILKRIEMFPVTAILWHRQCGKTTLASEFDFDHYFDLENPRWVQDSQCWKGRQKNHIGGSGT